MSAPVLDENTRLRPNPNVHSRPLGNEPVVLDFGNGEYFALDEIGAAVWKQIEAGASLAEAAVTISANYAVPTATALNDIRALAGELLQRSLVALR